MESNKERLLVAILSLCGAFALIALHGKGIIDLSDFGIAGVAVWVTIIIQFYFRKRPDGEKGEKGGSN